ASDNGLLRILSLLLLPMPQKLTPGRGADHSICGAELSGYTRYALPRDMSCVADHKPLPRKAKRFFNATGFDDGEFVPEMARPHLIEFKR
ncbi:MAG: hypothetical protein ABJH20_10685, partial [Rhizobiaceae bacterium]